MNLHPTAPLPSNAQYNAANLSAIETAPKKVQQVATTMPTDAKNVIAITLLLFNRSINVDKICVESNEVVVFSWIPASLQAVSTCFELFVYKTAIGLLCRADVYNLNIPNTSLKMHML